MDDHEIEPGMMCAFIASGTPFSDPLQAAVLTDPLDGWVTAAINHPDLGTKTQRIKTSELYGEWNAVSAYPPKTWTQLAESSYQRVQSQRRIAARLRALGIHREDRHYAMRGGTAHDYGGHTSNLYLTHSEFDTLLTLAEKGLVESHRANRISRP